MRSIAGNRSGRSVAFRKAQPGRQNSQSYSFPAPVGGLNLRDSAANMPETDATIMDNWFPETNDVRVRKGPANHVTGFTGQVESLLPYNNPDGTHTLFAAANNAIYDATTAGAVGSAVVSGLTNNRWQSVNFTNSSEVSYLFACNGADDVQLWDGSTWSNPTLTGITNTEVVNVSVFKRRLWLTRVNSLNAYYLPVDAIGGEVRSVPLGGIAKKGGFLMATDTWTIDAGEGADDYWVGITSEGEVIVYRGTDPISSATWKLHGVWNIGAPIGRRCFLKRDGDLLILTVGGIIPLSKLVVSGQTDPNIAITNKIEKGVGDAARINRANFGWSMLFHPSIDMILLNIPATDGTFQFAMNTITGNWGKFKGLAANCWALVDDIAYYGGNTVVATFWEEFDDFGANIETDLKQAENYFGSRGRLKYFKGVRPIVLSDGAPEVGVRINPDFQDVPVTESLSFVPLDVGFWDSGLWDSALWGGNLFVNKEWRTASEVATSGGLRMKTVSAGIEVRFQSSDHLFEYGGVIA